MFFLHKFKISWVYQKIVVFTQMVSRQYSNSLFKKWVDSKFLFNNLWQKSFLAQILDSLFCNLSKTIINAGVFISDRVETGIFGTVYKAIKKRVSFHHILALALGSIFLVYSSVWNNWYATIIAISFTFILIYIKRDELFRPSKIDFFLLLFLLSIPLGILSATDKIDAVRISMLVITALLLLLCIISVLNTDRKFSEFIKIVSFMIFITAVFAVIQGIVGVRINPEWVDIEHNVGMPGRVFSTMENPNNYAELLVLFIPFMLAIFLIERKKLLKLMWLMVIVVSVVALAMTYSRSCWVAIVIAVIVFFLIYDYKLLLPVLILGILGIPYIPQSIINRIFTIGSLSDTSNFYRLYIWDTCIKLLRNYGICGLGIGPQTFRDFYRPIAYKKASTVTHSHMLYIELILEYGILGFIGFMGYYVRIIRGGLKVVSLASKQQKAFVAAGIGALVGICFAALVEYIWYYPRNMFAHFIVMGLLVAVARNVLTKKLSV